MQQLISNIFKQFCYTVTLTLLCFVGKAQSPQKHFTELLKFDNLLFIDNSPGVKPKTKIIGDTCYLNLYNYETSHDTFTLLKVNMRDKQISKQNFVITGLHLLMSDGRLVVSDFDLNSNNLVVLVDNSVFIYWLKDGKNTRAALGNYSNYTQLKLFQSYLVLTKSYDSYNAFKKVVKTEIALFDLATQQITKSIQPVVNDIELTHSPIEPITFFYDKIVVAQNNSYTFTMYDSLLNIVQSVTDFKVLKNTYNAQKLHKLKRKKSSALFSYIGENYFKAGLLESIKPINENAFIVRYHDGDKKYTDSRLLDLWVKDSISNQFKFTGVTYLNNYLEHYNRLIKDTSLIFTKDNYHEYTEDRNTWGNNKMVRVRMASKVYPIGYTVKQFQIAVKEFSKNSAPVICISFFDIIY
ncbi:MAG: hypothetical protein V4643_07190 [Bacteroidota bacterium]